MKNELRYLMWRHAGNVRAKEDLDTALSRVNEMLALPIGKLLRLRLWFAQGRDLSLGAHYIQKGIYR